MTWRHDWTPLSYRQRTDSLRRGMRVRYARRAYPGGPMVERTGTIVRVGGPNHVDIEYEAEGRARATGQTHLDQGIAAEMVEVLY